MFVHAIWATVVLVKKDEKMIANFHQFSVAVWLHSGSSPISAQWCFKWWKRQSNIA